MGYWEDNEQAKADLLKEHSDKVGPEEPPRKETLKQWAFGGAKDETWSDTAKRWTSSFVESHNKQFSRKKK